MNSSEKPDPLPGLLAAWRLEPPRDPQFRAAVWTRLQRHSAETWTLYVRNHLVAWSLVCGLAIAAAGWTGHRVAQVRLDGQRERMVVSYLGELDPRVMAKMSPESRR